MKLTELSLASTHLKSVSGILTIPACQATTNITRVTRHPFVEVDHDFASIGQTNIRATDELDVRVYQLIQMGTYSEICNSFGNILHELSLDTHEQIRMFAQKYPEYIPADAISVDLMYHSTQDKALLASLRNDRKADGVVADLCSFGGFKLHPQNKHLFVFPTYY